MFTTHASSFKFTKQVAEVILGLDAQDNNVRIFGGYVRDSILHDHHAKQFYMNDVVREASLEVTQTLYSTPSFLPSYNERTIVASDIDCLMSTATLDKLIKALKDHSIIVLNKEEHLLCVYQEGLSAEDGKLHLTKLKLGLELPEIVLTVLTKPALSSLKKLKVCVDVVHAPDISGLEPPFGKIDFECNALILDKSGQITASNKLFYAWEDSPLDKLTKLSHVVDDIKQKVAVAFEKSPLFRTVKMMHKGWHIKEGEEGTFELIPVGKVPDKDMDVCLICLDSFNRPKGETHMLKRSCCSAKYHTKCFATLTSKSNEHFSWKCPMCASPFDENEIENRDIVLW
jgi:hypothetical protein